MPLPVAQRALFDGFTSIPKAALIKIAPVLVVLYLVRVYFQGSSNGSERNMHGKVVMVTVSKIVLLGAPVFTDFLQGGTSGVGSEVVRGLAIRGAQIVLLTQDPVGDPFLVEYIDDMRATTGNDLITAEQVDLASLHSIRTFATKWIDNAPPRRLDMIILCANTMTPRGGKLQSTEDGVEIMWGINYLANFHLLSILSPAIRAQPPDRDVRILMGMCTSYIAGELPVHAERSDEDTNGSAKKSKKTASKTAARKQSSTTFSPSAAYASSKLALMTFALAFQKHLSSYARPDKNPYNARVILVDPGLTRTPGMRRYLSWGSITGLLLYLVMYPFWWIVLKSPSMGAQSFLYAAMEAEYGRGEGGWLIQECGRTRIKRGEVQDEAVQKALWEYSEGMIQEAEKRGALARAEKKKKEAEVKAAEPAKSKGPEKKQPTSRRGRKAG